MLRGTVNPDDDAIVQVTLHLGKSEFQCNAILDTGFNGYISVPKSIVRRSNWQRVGSESYELANGEIVRESIYVGNIKFDRRHLEVLVVQLRSRDVLIGSKLLRGKLCEIDYKTRKLRIRSGGIVR